MYYYYYSTREITVPYYITRELKVPYYITRELKVPYYITREIKVPYYITRELKVPYYITREIRVPYSIQSNSIYLYSPFSQITNLSQSALQSVHIDIPVPEPHIGSGTTPKQPFTGKKREETFRRATEEDPSPGWTGAIDVM